MKKYKIDKLKCAGCGACLQVCPHQAIKIGDDGKAVIDYKKCAGCSACIKAFPFDAIKEVSKKETRQPDLSAVSSESDSRSEKFLNLDSFFGRREEGRGMGAGRGRGRGPQGGRGGGARNR